MDTNNTVKELRTFVPILSGLVTPRDHPLVDLGSDEAVEQCANIVESLVLSEQVVVSVNGPALEVVGLIRWLSEDGLLKLLDEGALRFASTPGITGFMSEAAKRGLNSKADPGVHRFVGQGPLWDSPQESVALMLQDQLSYPAEKSRRLAKRIADYFDASLDLQKTFDGVEAYAYSQADEILSETGVQGEGAWRALKGDAAEVHYLLRVFGANLEAECAAASNCNVIRTDDIGLEVLRRKPASLSDELAGKSHLDKILSFESLPDIQALIRSGYPATNVLAMRLDPKVVALRKFLRSIHKDASEVEILRAYYETFKNKTTDKLPVKAVRWFVNTVLGVVNPILGLGGSVADSFFLDRYLNGWSPRVYVDRYFRPPQPKSKAGAALPGQARFM